MCWHIRSDLLNYSSRAVTELSPFVFVAATTTPFKQIERGAYILYVTLTNLEKLITENHKQTGKFLVTYVKIDDYLEIIVNTNENLLKKLDYFKQAYNEDMQHKHSPNVKIVYFEVSDLNEIQSTFRVLAAISPE